MAAVRIYPVPFRLLDYDRRYSKYDWIEASFSKNTRDPQPKSFRPNDPNSITKVGELGTQDVWRERRNIVLNKTQVFDRLGRLIDSAHANELSLAVFKPTKIIDFVWEADDRDWDIGRQANSTGIVQEMPRVTKGSHSLRSGRNISTRSPILTCTFFRDHA